MPEPDCFLRYRLSADMRNFTSGKSHIYVLAACRCTRSGFKMVLFTEPSEHLCRRYIYRGPRLVKAPSQSGDFTRWQHPFVRLFVCRLKRLLMVAGAYGVGHSAAVTCYADVTFSSSQLKSVLPRRDNHSTVTRLHTTTTH